MKGPVEHDNLLLEPRASLHSTARPALVTTAARRLHLIMVGPVLWTAPLGQYGKSTSYSQVVCSNSPKLPE
jgi:hypothetical protein